MGDAEVVAVEGGKGQEVVTKHPLEHPWTFWFDNPNSMNKSRQNLSWGSSLRSVYTVSTVEEFWCVYKDVFQPSRLIPGTDFHLFKANIQPKWEDPSCAKGGKWTINNRGSKSVLDTQWLHTLLALIGEQFEESDEICGVVASVRQRGDKLALWTKTASNEAAQISIGRKWKELLDIDDKIGYIVHDDAKKDKNAKNRYTV